MKDSPDTLNVDVVGVPTDFYMYREHFPFGDFTGYRSSGADPLFLFWYPGLGPVTGAELADILDREYVQQSEAGITSAMTHYSELRNLAPLGMASRTMVTARLTRQTA